MDEGASEMAIEDIWDDSALVRSWDEALSEYKKYHSIHANGGRLEDLPDYQADAKPETSDRHEQSEPILPPSAAPRATSDQSASSNCQAQAAIPGIVAPGAHHRLIATEKGTNGAAEVRIDDGVATNGNGRGTGDGAGESQDVPSGGAAVPPQALLGSMQDEGLKRLLMSWYYAGYYTGLYEGQQKH